MTVLSITVLFFLASCAHLLPNKDREKAKLYLQIGADQLGNREYQKALSATLEAIKYDPEYAAAYNHLALIYMETKRHQRSEEAFQKALEIQSSYPEVFNNLGVLRNRQEKYSEAVTYFEKALSDDKYPTPENAHTNMGYAYYKMGDLLRAKVHHQKALDLAPQFCLASKNMGDVYAKERKYARASEYFQQAATHCPLFQESQYKLGLALMKMGQRHVAKAQLEKLVEKHKTGPYVDRSQEVLKYLH